MCKLFPDPAYLIPWRQTTMSANGAHAHLINFLFYLPYDAILYDCPDSAHSHQINKRRAHTPYDAMYGFGFGKQSKRRRDNSKKMIIDAL